jgi:hypothetical protein
MIIRNKHAEQLGFKSSDLFKGGQRAASSIYYKVESKELRVIYLSNYSNQHIGVFYLTPKEMRKYQAGRLSLIPDGCCSPGRESQKNDPAIVYSGDIKDFRHLRKLLSLVVL